MHAPVVPLPPSKMFNPAQAGREILTAQISAQEKPIMMALNIPTYLNLYGYGYRNVYGLHELVDVNDPRVEFAGTMTTPVRPEDLQILPGE